MKRVPKQSQAKATALSRLNSKGKAGMQTPLPLSWCILGIICREGIPICSVRFLPGSGSSCSRWDKMLQESSLSLVLGTQWNYYHFLNISSGFWWWRKGCDTPSTLPFRSKYCCTQAGQALSIKCLLWGHRIWISLFFFHASDIRSEW